MKRWVILITICMLIGAIINVAVAWWFAIRQDWFNSKTNYTYGLSYDGPGYTMWFVDTRILVGSTSSDSFSIDEYIEVEKRELTSEETLPYWAELIRPDPNASMPFPFPSKTAIAHGWPLRSMMRLSYLLDLDKIDLYDTELYSLNWSAPDWLRGERRFDISPDRSTYLPLKIIWLGFIANTLLYSLAPFLIFILKFKLRGFLRFKRKQCTKCGYPIGQSEVCTECGAQLKAS